MLGTHVARHSQRTEGYAKIRFRKWDEQVCKTENEEK